uniref:Nuclear transcription factor Y subunit A-1-like isoform X2 n=1 Tax=Rhizophora mucronata TaxID=61149 RepID=A0A2P2LAQ7_RHIMU
MQSRTNSASRLEQGTDVAQPYTVHPEPWWRGNGYAAISPAGAGANASSPEGDDGSESNGNQSLSNGRMNDEDDGATKESQGTASSRSGTRNHLII